MNVIQISRSKPNLGYNNAALLIKKAVNNALKAENIDDPCFVSVMLTDGEGIRQYNREYRGADKETDVLSFPLNELTAGKFDKNACETDPGSGLVLLGDILINLERCALQGAELGHGFSREVQYLATHSVLHLLGYDHVDEGEMKKQMRSREKAIMGDK